MNGFLKTAMMHPGVEVGVRYSERLGKVLIWGKRFGRLPKVRTIKVREFDERFVKDGSIDEDALYETIEEVAR